MKNNNCNDKNGMGIMKVLERLNEGYKKRDIKSADDYMKELFINDDSLYILGTSSEELCPGVDEVKDLLESDWEYWGDLAFDLEKAVVKVDGDIAWFGVPGTVKSSFQHTKERFESYVDFVKTWLKKDGLSSEQRIAFANWVMALTYHHQSLEQREYFDPVRFTGVMIRENEKWKIAQGKFSLAKGIFPDERMELDEEFTDNFNKDKEMFGNHKKNELSNIVGEFLAEASEKCLNEDMRESAVEKFFSEDAWIVSPDVQWHMGRDEIEQFMRTGNNASMEIDRESLMVDDKEDKIWITGTGILKKKIEKSKVADSVVETMLSICDGDKTGEEKLYDLHKQAGYALKEICFCDEYTYAMRYSGVITKTEDGFKIDYMHMSFPFYWILEGKY